MPLIIEDGTVVASANSFVSLADARAYALDRGVTLSVDDTVLTSELIKACDWFIYREPNFQGYRTNPTQRLPFPREDVYIYGEIITNDTIPDQLVEAQIKLAMLLEEGVEIRPNGDGQTVVRERVGPIETEYLKQSASNITPILNEVNDLLLPLTNGVGGAFHVVERA